MKKEYKFIYNLHEASASFTVDTEVFTKEKAQGLLDFFVWEYDKSEDPIDEAMKKYALAVIKEATFENLSLYGVVKAFDEREGYYKIDGSEGISINSCSEYEFDEEELTMVVKEV